MAASITFQADFSSFSQALDRATLKLQSFALEPSKVEKALNKIGDSFSGKKIISEATLSARAIAEMGEKGDLASGLLKLTTDELQRAGTQARAAADKMKALGLEVPPNIDRLAKSIEPIPKHLTLADRAAGLAKTTFGQMFSAFTAANLVDKAVGTLISFGKEAFTSASRVVDLSAKLNVSTDAIQRWDFVAKQTGSTMEDFASNAFKLGTRLSGGAGSVQQAVKELGLSFQQLRALKPEDQFDVVVTKLGEMQDATKRNALGVAIFGKGFESIAASVAQDYGKIAKAATLSTNEQLVALDNAGDEWDKLTDRIGKATQGALASILHFSNEALKGILFEGNKKPTGDISGLLDPRLTQSAVTITEDYVAQLKEMRAALAALSPEIRKQIDAAIALNKTNDEIAAQYPVSTEVLSLYRSELKATTASTKEHTKAVAEMKTPLLEAKGSMLSLATAMPAVVRSLDEGLPVLASWHELVQKEPLDLKKWENALYALPPAIKSVGVELDRAQKKAGGFESIFSGISGGLKDVWQGMSGGNGISGLLSGIGSGISLAIGSLITGGIATAISAGISLIEKGLGSLWGKLTKSEGKKVNDLRDAAIEAAGGFEALNTKAHLAGVSLDRVLAASKVKDYDAAWKDLNETLGDFADEQAKLAEEQSADQARLQSAIEKYKFSIEELGPILRQQELDKQAKELIEDWRVLVSAGVDIVTVNEHMAKTIGDYFKVAIKTGTEIPAAMKPILQSMIDQGLLVDESGTKIKDLEGAGVKFSETMTEGFDRVVKKLDELIVKLQNAGTAIGDIPKTVEVGVQYRDSGIPVWQGEPQSWPSFAGGTRGAYPDFGSGTKVLLHGRERVMTEAERAPDRSALETIASALEGIDRRISSAVSRAVSDALILAPSRR